MARIFIVIAWYGNGIFYIFSGMCDLYKFKRWHFVCGSFSFSVIAYNSIGIFEPNRKILAKNTQTQTHTYTHTSAKSMGHHIKLQSYRPLLGPVAGAHYLIIIFWHSVKYFFIKEQWPIRSHLLIEICVRLSAFVSLAAFFVLSQCSLFVVYISVWYFSHLEWNFWMLTHWLDLFWLND